MKRPREVHWFLLCLAIGVAWCALCATAASAQTTPPIAKLELSTQATKFLDSLALDARTHRVENGACITSYAVRDSTLWIDALGPAHYMRADSITIWGDSTQHYPGICPMGIPSIHSHVSNGGLTPPSDIDRRTAAMRGMWNALLQVRANGYLLFIY